MVDVRGNSSCRRSRSASGRNSCRLRNARVAIVVVVNYVEVVVVVAADEVVIVVVVRVVVLFVVVEVVYSCVSRCCHSLGRRSLRRYVNCHRSGSCRCGSCG